MSEMTDARRVVVIDDYGLTALAVGGHTEYGGCSRAELWAAIMALDRAAVAVAHAAVNEMAAGFRREYGYEAAAVRHIEAMTRLRELLGMEAES